MLFGARVRTPPTPDYSVTLANRTSYRATVAGTDAPADLVVLKMSAPKLRAIILADSDKLKVGQFVLAMGHPLGFSKTVTFGIISTLRRTIGFAISSNRVFFITKQIIKTGNVGHSGRPYLGVGSVLQVTLHVAARYGLRVNGGMLIQHVTPNGPAERAGLRAGDVIVRLAGRATLRLEAFNETLGRLKPGQKAAGDGGSVRGRAHRDGDARRAARGAADDSEAGPPHRGPSRP